MSAYTILKVLKLGDGNLKQLSSYKVILDNCEQYPSGMKTLDYGASYGVHHKHCYPFC